MSDKIWKRSKGNRGDGRLENVLLPILLSQQCLWANPTDRPISKGVFKPSTTGERTSSRLLLLAFKNSSSHPIHWRVLYVVIKLISRSMFFPGCCSFCEPSKMPTHTHARPAHLTQREAKCTYAAVYTPPLGLCKCHTCCSRRNLIRNSR